MTKGVKFYSVNDLGCGNNLVLLENVLNNFNSSKEYDDINENHTENDDPKIDVQRLSVLSDLTILSGQAALLPNPLKNKAPENRGFILLFKEIR